jgi:hypothetical protein
VSIYTRSILPRLIDLAMRNRSAEAERARLVPLAAGDVLEIGIGSALNVPHYPKAVRALLGVDPSAELWRIGRHRLVHAAFPPGTSRPPRRPCPSTTSASTPS